MKNIIYLSLSLLLIQGCATRGMRVLTTRAANIAVSKDIKKIVLVNRTQGDGSGVVEGILSGELPGSDAALVQECMRGLNETLNLSTRFQTTMHDQILKSGNASGTQFGAYLEWAEVDSICNKTGADALLAIEFFDSDFLVSPPIPRVGSNPLVFDSRATANARGGFRLYDRAKKAIVYEDFYRHTRNWTSSGGSIIAAANQLLRRNDALRTISYDVGSRFAQQLVPLNYWEDRLMFRGKEDATKRAERLALTENWAGAAEIWKQAYNNPTAKAKHKAAAAYNLALSYEVMGNLDEAKSWIQKAYVETGNPKALRYSDIIDRLIVNRARLEQQNN